MTWLTHIATAIGIFFASLFGGTPTPSVTATTSPPVVAAVEATTTSASPAAESIIVIKSQLKGLSDFSLTIPAEFGIPDYAFIPKPSIPVPSAIDEEDITFYQPNQPHDLLQNATGLFYLNIEAGLLPQAQGETLEDVASANMPTVHGQWTDLTVDGHNAVVASIGSNTKYPYDPNPTYFIEMGNGFVLQLFVGASRDLTLTQDQMESLRATEDSVIESIDFSPANGN